MKTKSPLRFSTLPRDYAALCAMLMPRPIHDRVSCQNLMEIASAFAGFEAEMNADQQDYFALLCSLIADYEDAAAPVQTPLQVLKHLLAEHGLTAADLSRILGASRTLGAMILREERSLTIEHARVLARRFGLPLGTFLE